MAARRLHVQETLALEADTVAECAEMMDDAFRALLGTWRDPISKRVHNQVRQPDSRRLRRLVAGRRGAPGAGGPSAAPPPPPAGGGPGPEARGARTACALRCGSRRRTFGRSTKGRRGARAGPLGGESSSGTSTTALPGQDMTVQRTASGLSGSWGSVANATRSVSVVPVFLKAWAVPGGSRKR